MVVRVTCFAGERGSLWSGEGRGGVVRGGKGREGVARGGWDHTTWLNTEGNSSYNHNTCSLITADLCLYTFHCFQELLKFLIL